MSSPLGDADDGTEDPDTAIESDTGTSEDALLEADTVEETENNINRPTKAESTIGRIAGKAIATVPKPLLGVRGTLFKRMAIKSLQNYHKVAGGDALAINAKAGQQLELLPVKYRSPEMVEEGEKPGWKAAGRDKVWNPAAEGNSVNYLGRTPLVQLQDDEHVEAGWLAPRVGHAIELDNYWPLFTNASFNVVVDAGPASTNGQQPVADGGMNFDLELDSPGQWMGDNVIDLDSGAGYDGMRISTRKAREWQAEHTDSEHMQMQEDRGYLRGLANGNEGPSVFKLLLLCAAIILGTFAIVFLGPELLGGSGSGGGINPLMAFPGLI